MDSLRLVTIGAHAERAFDLIQSGITECGTGEEQRLLLESILCQCAAFTRLLSGEEEFLALLDRIRNVTNDIASEHWPKQLH
ncbi:MULTISPECIES: hypothetical protein [Pseudomonas]|uniref:hypothetical protein n=1 Tax=Pseudomonas TaxID=286 RepID=UPI002361E3CA|nr:MULTISPECIES: hypothetical protein [Pseudomonas]WJV25507.1 hypothetical protein PSR66_05550 [Pseudomonas chlororaphis]